MEPESKEREFAVKLVLGAVGVVVVLWYLGVFNDHHPTSKAEAEDAYQEQQDNERDGYPPR